MGRLERGVLSELEVNVKVSEKTLHFLEDTGNSIIEKYNDAMDNTKQDLKKDFVNDMPQLEENNTVFNDLLNIENLQEKREGVYYDTDQNDEQIIQESTSFKEITEHVITINLKKHENEKFMKNSNTCLKPVVNYETEINLEESAQEIVPLAMEEVQREEVQGSGSPCQSDCSRATRWEALADMAAELPPSLTVDPITGQIYAARDTE